MIGIGRLDKHSSSPTAAYMDLAALTKRPDLYTGDDFYFGFASSNHTFLDIIGAREPLAIKHGPIFSIYRHDGADGYSCHTSLIDPFTKELLPLISMMAAPTNPSAASTFRQLLPWEFSDTYVDSFVPPEAGEEKRELGPESTIFIVLEQLANNNWPDAPQIRQLPEAIATILEKTKDLTIELSDIAAYRERFCIPSKAPKRDDFIAPYHPFHDNLRLSIDFIMSEAPSRITVRQVGGAYPRIEVIMPGLPAKEAVIFVAKADQDALYRTYRDSLNNPKKMHELLIAHYPKQVEAYLLKQGLEGYSASASSSTKP